MGIKLSQLYHDRANVLVHVDGGVVSVTYRPSKITPILEESIQKRINEQRGGAALVELLTESVIDWDLLDNDEKPIPPSREIFEKLPIKFLSLVCQAILEDLRPNPQRGGSFASG